MNTKYTLPTLSIILLLTTMLACNLSNATSLPTVQPETATDTIAPPTPTTWDPTPIAEPNGLLIQSGRISFTIPTGLASGAKSQWVEAVEDQNGPGWDLAPAHSTFLLENYPLQGTLHQPMIYIYPTSEYEKVNNGAAESLKRLRALISGAGMGIDNHTVPFVPFFNATQTFEALAMPLQTANGDGIRMVTQYDQAVIPVNNHELIYQFEGLTSSGNEYIIAIFPINSSLLPADDNPNASIPAGGVPLNGSDPAAYFDAVAQNLNSASAESFTPSLKTLDTLIESIGIVIP